MLWLTGRRPLAVKAVGNRICTTGTAFRYNDYCAATLHFDGGMIGRLSANYGCVHRHQHVLRLFGTRASFIYDDAGARLHELAVILAAARAACCRTSLPLPASKGDLILRSSSPPSSATATMPGKPKACSTASAWRWPADGAACIRKT